jgi:hypothetical protein
MEVAMLRRRKWLLNLAWIHRQCRCLQTAVGNLHRCQRPESLGVFQTPKQPWLMQKVKWLLPLPRLLREM